MIMFFMGYAEARQNKNAAGVLATCGDLFVWLKFYRSRKCALSLNQ
jgi:hypothetical protein